MVCIPALAISSALLVAAGARVEAEWLESEEVRADPSMLTVLRGPR